MIAIHQARRQQFFTSFLNALCSLSVEKRPLKRLLLLVKLSDNCKDSVLLKSFHVVSAGVIVLSLPGTLPTTFMLRVPVSSSLHLSAKDTFRQLNVCLWRKFKTGQVIVNVNDPRVGGALLAT